jgi:hypothetical protein
MSNKSTGIDYSKWDKIDCSSSEEEEDSGQPRVTHLDAPSTITRTSDGNLIIGGQQQPGPVNSSNKTNKYEEKIQDWSQNGGVVTTEAGSQLYWSQDRFSVCLRLLLPSTGIKGKDLRVELQGMIPFRDRFSAVGNEHVSSLKLLWRDPTDQATRTLLDGDLPHTVHATEDEELDWGIDRVTDHNSSEELSYWTINLPKAVPMQGVIIWWRRPLKQFEEIDTRQANPDDASKAQAFQKSWDEAHRQFREKMQEKKSTNS